MHEELQLLNAIDFLPQRYREARLKRSAGAWRILVVIVLCGMLLSTAVFQHRLLWQAEADLARIETIHTSATRLAKAMADEQAKFPGADNEASLFTYLRHPWPRTALINAVLAPIPESIRLSNLSLGFELPERPVGEANEVKQDDPVDKSPSPARDLKRLRTELDGGRWVVTVNGSARDLADLHVYVAELERSSLFSKVELVSIDSPHTANSNEARFVVRVVIRPGYGQPRGPVIGAEKMPESERPGELG